MRCEGFRIYNMFPNPYRITLLLGCTRLDGGVSRTPKVLFLNLENETGGPDFPRDPALTSVCASLINVPLPLWGLFSIRLGLPNTS